eukprot:TRINITY_DN83096_c0_g1_i1.p1 TRINITY_DN83096_c0_g1~~TRINITY_DN83096_c0_g1_i1.p1  ORF type:complete len:243 (-),score=58.06 TRINITY_DN83096_c0_g1_i1:99-827(-)
MAAPAQQPQGGYAAQAQQPVAHTGKGPGDSQNLEQLFHDALEQVFARWTLVNLALEQGWGGRDTRQKLLMFKEELVQVLVAGGRKRRPPVHTNVDDVQFLCDFIYERLFSYFNCEADDESDKEVATVSLRLFNTCRAGDPSYAQEVIQLCKGVSVNLAKSQGVDKREYATVEDELLDKMNGMELDEGYASGSISDSDNENCNMDGGDGGLAQPAAPVKQAPPEPEVDEDGFTSVVKGGRRRR